MLSNQSPFGEQRSKSLQNPEQKFRQTDKDVVDDQFRVNVMSDTLSVTLYIIISASLDINLCIF